MNKNLTYLFALVFFSICTLAKAQQPVEEWARKYSGMGSQKEYPSSMAVDAVGNIYVVGTTQQTDYSEIRFSIVIIKYSPTGDKLWEKVYEANSTATAHAIAVDNTGGVYVTGVIDYESNPDFLTIRFDTETGEVDWDKTYNGASNGQDESTAIAVDNLGGIYITGSSSTAPYGNIGDFVTIRYDALSGEQSWVSSYDGYNGGQDIPAAIAVDITGGVFVTGYSEGGGMLPDNVTIAYNAADGTERWKMRGDSVSATDIAVDNLGGVYVTGTKFDPISNNGDFLTTRYDAVTGTQSSWDMAFNGDYNGYDEAVAITTDNQGGIYVTGHSETAGNSFDFITIRYDAATQTRSWIETYDGGSARASGIVTDNQGRVFITGYSSKDAHYDFVTVGYMAASGKRIWAQRYDGPANGYDASLNIAADGLGGVYVSGVSEGLGTLNDMTTIRYEASNGFETWVERVDVKGHLEDRAIAIATDAEGNSYVTGTSNYGDFMDYNITHIVTIKYSPSGDTLWVSKYEAEQNQSARSTAIAVDAEGNIYITGNIYRSYFVETTTQMVTVKYSPSGEELWAKKFEREPDSRAAFIAVDNTGGVYVTGTSYQAELDDYGYYNVSSSEYITIRYDESTGEERWVSSHAAIGYNHNTASALALDNSGGVYVTGVSRKNTSYAISTVQYNAATGTENWRAEPYIRTGVNTTFARAIAVDNNGGVYVTGYSYSVNDPNYSYDYTTVGYDAASGNLRWDKHYNGPGNNDDQAIAIAADNTGGVYVTGQSDGNNNSSYSDFATIRYDALTGHEDWLERYDGPSGNNDYARAIAVDNQGGVYVTGSSYGEDYRASVFNTVKYATTDGKPIWDIQSSGSRDVAMDLAVDAEGNVFVTGYSFFPGTIDDFLTIKYSQNQCPALADAAIQGGTTVRSNTDGAVFSLAGSDASSFTWSITGSNGTTYSNFTRQGTSSIAVNWSDSPGFYKVMVTYGRQAACPTRDTTLYVHVFDEEAGFVTGGGWSNSPANPLNEFMQQETKAHWSLNTKYKKGDDNTLQGGTSFRLESESFIFRSTSLEARTLVIDGNLAFYRGEGQVSYSDEAGVVVSDPRRFSFLISAMDGDFDGAKAQDRLRILVWELKADGSRGAVVYDNQPTCSDNLDENAPPCEAIGGGNIVIHAPNMKTTKKNAVHASTVETAGKALTAYPTSFSDHTTLAFSMDEGTGYSLALYDMKGMLVKQIAEGTAKAGQHHELELRADGLPTGVYLARLATGLKVQTVKIVVRR